MQMCVSSLKLQGVLNLLEPLICRDAHEVLLRMAQAGRGPLNYLELYESIYQERNEVVISFFGDLSFQDDQALRLLQRLKPILDQKNCLLNFTYCVGIDNQGIGFLLKMRKFQETNGFSLKITG